MSLLKLFQKARSTSAATSESAVEADLQSQYGELSDELTDSDDLGRDIEPNNESDDDGCNESVPGPPPMKNVGGSSNMWRCSYLHRQVKAAIWFC